MTKEPTERTEEEEAELAALMKQSKFFQDKEMKYEDFKDLVMNFEFESSRAGETVFEINSTGETFYIILKGIVRVMVKNPSVRDWGMEYKYYTQLKEWKKKFDVKADQVEKERMEEYQLDIKKKQEEERYQKSKTKGNSMSLVIKNLKSTERELLDVFAENLRQKLALTQHDTTTSDTKQKKAHGRQISECTETNFIKHFRKADSLFQFDVEKHMSLTKKEKMNLSLLKKYGQMQFLVENKTLIEGDTFGELAIISKNPRAATISCLTDCYFAKMNASDYN